MTEPSTAGSGTIVTFYSFKGGTGRSMALANTAWILASNGLRVLVVDWDLESPGLHRYFHPFLVDKTLRSSPGVLDLVRDFAAAALDPGGEAEDDAWFRARARVLPYASSLDWRDFPGAGCIDFVPAGRQTAAYSQAVSTFEWDTFYDRLGGGALLAALGEDMRSEYDYVLIDSRTGLSDTAGICTVHLPDVVVDCFTLSTQSIEGAATVARSIVAQRRQRPVRVVPVLMRIDVSEKGKLDAGRELAQGRFAAALGASTPEAAGVAWEGVEIPYVPFYAFEEILAPFGDAPGQPTSLLAAFERLTSQVTEGYVSRLQPMDETVRRARLTDFERIRRVRLPDVVISYSAWDRLWAEWIRSELAGLGYGTRVACVELPPPSTSSRPSERTLALLSREYLVTPAAPEIWSEAARPRRLGPGLLAAVSLDGVRPEPPFDRPSAVDLSGLGESEVRDRLRLALDHQPSDGSARQGGGATVRFPGSIPRIFSAQGRNGLFTGRAGVLEELRDRLLAGGPEIEPQLLYGLGGVGKTQIAIEYAHRFAADYDLVWWVPAEHRGLVGAALARLLPQLGLPSGGDQTADVNAVFSALRSADPRRRWLLIFDNVEDPARLVGLLPTHGPAHVIITSRAPGTSPGASIEVTVFARENSVDLLMRRAEGLAAADADAVAGRLGDLPLAIEQAGAWLAATGMSADTYLDLLDTRMADVLRQPQGPDYPHTVAATWLVSLDRLRDQRPAAARLMELCACFASEPIPTRLLLKEPTTSLLSDLDPTLGDPMLLAQLFQEVVRYSLARVDSAKGTLDVHRLVQVVIREQMEPELRRQTERSVLDILVAANPGDTDDPSTWPQYAELWPHVAARAVDSDVLKVRLLLLDMVRYLWRSGARASARDVAQRTIERWERDHDPDDATTLRLRDELSNALHMLGEYQLALATSQDVVDRLKATLGAKHPYTLIAMTSLAGRLLAVGDHQRSRQLSKDLYEGTRLVFGESHPRSTNALNQVLNTTRFTGDYREALRLSEQLYELRKEVNGPAHPDTLVTAARLGRDYRQVGEYGRSRSRLDAAVKDLVNILGKDHQETIRGRSNLAVTTRKLGEFNNAHGLSTAALDRAARQLGAAHPDTQAISLNLACDDAALERFENAMARTEQVLDQYREQFGVDHYLPLLAMNNLSIFARQSGHRADALNLSRQAREGLSRLFGETHPHTLCAAINHASDLAGLGEAEAARALGEQTFATAVENLGARHPDTLAAGHNLSLDRQADGDPSAAQALHTDVLRQTIAVLGERHPNSRTVAEGGRLNCDVEQPLI